MRNRNITVVLQSKNEVELLTYQRDLNQYAWRIGKAIRFVTAEEFELSAHSYDKLFLFGNNIPLKTFWFLYPNMKRCYCGSDYQVLCQLMQTVIGQLRLCDVNAELCEGLLVELYPDAPESVLWRNYTILSDAMEKAVSFGYCTKNPLAEALRHKKLQKKLFAQVKKQLVKKHLTMPEFRRLLRSVLRKVEEGQYEYVGVLIRLLTGLESNIVCALRWCDLRTAFSFDGKYFVITRQLSNDGKEVHGFSDVEDYICYPVSALLDRLLTGLKNRLPNISDKEQIVNSILRLYSPATKKFLTPAKLTAMTKETIKGLEIADNYFKLAYDEDTFTPVCIVRESERISEHFRRRPGARPHRNGCPFDEKRKEITVEMLDRSGKGKTTEDIFNRLNRDKKKTPKPPKRGSYPPKGEIELDTTEEEYEEEEREIGSKERPPQTVQELVMILQSLDTKDYYADKLVFDQILDERTVAAYRRMPIPEGTPFVVTTRKTLPYPYVQNLENNQWVLVDFWTKSPKSYAPLVFVLMVSEAAKKKLFNICQYEPAAKIHVYAKFKKHLTLENTYVSELVKAHMISASFDDMD